MKYWLKNGKSEMQLPVNPSGFEYQGSQANETICINSIGEVNLLGNRNLGTISISSFFPNQQYDFLQCKAKKPYEYCKKINKWKDDKDVIRLKITGTIIDFDCTIETFNFGESDSSGDVSFNLELKEYKRIKSNKKDTGKVEATKSSKKVSKVETTRSTKKVKTTTYLVKKGDTLSAIAKKYTGSAGNAKAIANRNGIKNINKIYVGQKLVIEV